MAKKVVWLGTSVPYGQYTFNGESYASYAAGKRWTHYFESKNTKDFIDKLSSKTHIPSSALIQSIRGGDVR